MSTVPKTFKLEPEVKDQVNRIVEEFKQKTGKTEGDFVAEVILRVGEEMMSDNIATVSGDLQQHFKSDLITLDTAMQSIRLTFQAQMSKIIDQKNVWNRETTELKSSISTVIREKREFEVKTTEIINRLNEENNNLQQQLIEFVNEIAEHNQKVENIRRDNQVLVDSLTGQLDSLKSQVSLIQENYNLAKKDKNKLINENENMKSRSDNLEKAARQLRNENTNLKQQFAEYKRNATFEKREAILEKEEAHRQEIMKAQGQINDLIASKDKLRDEIQNLQQIIATTESKLVKSEEEVVLLQNQITKLETELDQRGMV